VSPREENPYIYNLGDQKATDGSEAYEKAKNIYKNGIATKRSITQRLCHVT
jgi:hypothetical protein